MKLLNDPGEKTSALERLHYEISRTLTTNKSCVEHKHPLQPEIKVAFVTFPQGASRTSDWNRNQVIKNRCEHKN